MRKDSVNVDKILNGLKTLTPREHDVLNQVVSGRLNKEIASELGITIRTVKEHRSRVMEKMEANSLAELVTMIVTLRLHENRMMT
jgi:two-component system, LuxR family, response regulator FixJ